MNPQPCRTPTAGTDAVALLEANQQLVLATLRAKDAEEQLRAAAVHKDEFLAMLGHELRNPLVPIRNAAEVLKHIAGQDKRLTWVHDVLVRQVGHITRLVDDLLDISLIARGALQLQLQPVDLAAVVAEVVGSVEPLIQRKHHRLDCALPPGPVWVQADAIRMAQVVENLLTNAAKYTPDGGVLALSLMAADGLAVMRVRDNGLGIAEDMRARIFELFVQDARAADRSEGGLGIGLALVRHLVGLHGGQIEVLSDGLGKGTEFVVRLPLLPCVPAAALSAAAAGDSAGGRVLVVDDDTAVGDSMAVLLRLYGWDVECAVDLPSALEAARTFRPQAVLMDISLPEADGYEVARRMSAVPGVHDSVRYIAVTGLGRPGDFERSAQAGFARHLVKPVDPDELDRVLRQVVDNRAAAG